MRTVLPEVPTHGVLALLDIFLVPAIEAEDDEFLRMRLATPPASR